MRPRKQKNPNLPSTPERILTQATQILARHGLDRSSLQMIADKAGISQTALLHHFSSKETLVEAVILRAISHCRSIISESIRVEDDGYNRLVKYGDGNCRWAMEFPHEAQLIILLYYLAAYDSRFSAFYEKVRTGAQDVLLEHLYAGRREGLFHFDDPSRAQAFLHEALIGAIINMLTSKPVSSTAGLKELRRKWRLAIRLATGYAGGLERNP